MAGRANRRVVALRATVATVGVLIVAKAILVVEALPISRVFSRKLWFHIFWKTLLFNVVVLIFRFIEELIPLLRKYEGFFAAAAQLDRETVWPQFWVFQLWMLCALFLYCVVSEVVHMVGAGKVKSMLFGPASSAPQGSRSRSSAELGRGACPRLGTLFTCGCRFGEDGSITCAIEPFRPCTVMVRLSGD